MSEERISGDERRWLRLACEQQGPGEAARLGVIAGSAIPRLLAALEAAEARPMRIVAYLRRLADQAGGDPADSWLRDAATDIEQGKDLAEVLDGRGAPGDQCAAPSPSGPPTRATESG